MAIRGLNRGLNMGLAIETHTSEESVRISCTGQVLLGNEIEDLSVMLDGMCVGNRYILLDLSAVENLDVCNLAPLLTVAERKRARGCKVTFAQFRGRVRQQLQFSKTIDRFSNS
jgi:ABC-type transporter Mla MlaB component